MVNMICSKCGSAYIVRDAHAEWSIRNQTWELAGLADTYYCDNCDDLVKPKERNLLDDNE